MTRQFLRKGDPKGDPEQIGPKMVPMPEASKGASGKVPGVWRSRPVQDRSSLV